MTWSKHTNGFRAPDVVADMEAGDPATDVDLLRRAAEDLRSPYLCNWDPKVAHALAEAMDKVARVIRLDPGMVGRVGYGEVVEVARAFMAPLEDQS